MPYADAEIKIYTVDHPFNKEEKTNLISTIPFMNYSFDKVEEFRSKVNAVADNLEKAYTHWDQYINIEVTFKRMYCNEE